MPREKKEVADARKVEIRSRHEQRVLRQRVAAQQQPGLRPQNPHRPQQPLPSLQLETTGHGRPRAQTDDTLQDHFTPMTPFAYDAVVNSAVSQVNPSLVVFGDADPRAPSEEDGENTGGPSQYTQAMTTTTPGEEFFDPPNMHTSLEFKNRMGNWVEEDIVVGWSGRGKIVIWEAFVITLGWTVRERPPDAKKFKVKCTLGAVEVVGYVDLLVRLPGKLPVELRGIFVVRSKAKKPRCGIFMGLHHALEIERRSKPRPSSQASSAALGQGSPDPLLQDDQVHTSIATGLDQAAGNFGPNAAVLWPQPGPDAFSMLPQYSTGVAHQPHYTNALTAATNQGFTFAQPGTPTPAWPGSPNQPIPPQHYGSMVQTLPGYHGFGQNSEMYTHPAGYSDLETGHQVALGYMPRTQQLNMMPTHGSQGFPPVDFLSSIQRPPQQQGSPRG